MFRLFSYRRSKRKRTRYTSPTHRQLPVGGTNPPHTNGSVTQQKTSQIQLYPSVNRNLENLRQLLDSPGDLVIRELHIGHTGHPCAVVCIDGLVDKDMVSQNVIHNIQRGVPKKGREVAPSPQQMLELLQKEVLSPDQVFLSDDVDASVLALLSGDTLLFIEGFARVLIVNTRGWASRGVEEPETEALVRGSREGFTENVRTSTALIRRQIRDPNLRLATYKVGRRSKKELIVAYVEGIVNPRLVQEVKRRLSAIDTDDAPESGFIEEWIQDSFLSPFPQVLATERPDKTAAALNQGKVAILLDGTPFVLIIPMTLGQMLQSPDDYNERWLIGTLIRLLRYIAAGIGLYLPAVYVALLTYQPGMIPSKMAFAIAAAREGVPLPAVIEALLMETTMELLREAGLRLPKPIGQTVGIVGGLVIGEAAVNARIVSPIMVIVVALTAISSFALPAYNLSIAIRIVRFAMIIASGVFGLYGIVLVTIMLCIHLVNLRSFGVPYLAPFVPTYTRDWKDLVIRAPLVMAPHRPEFMQTKDPVRLDKQNRP